MNRTTEASVTSEPHVNETKAHYKTEPLVIETTKVSTTTVPTLNAATKEVTTDSIEVTTTMEAVPKSTTQMKATSIPLTNATKEGVLTTVAADTNSTIFQAGTEYVRVPSGSTHISALRYASDGTLYISGAS